jgi:hypothetical protein
MSKAAIFHSYLIPYFSIKADVVSLDKFPAIYGTRNFIVTITRALNPSLDQVFVFHILTETLSS